MIWVHVPYDMLDAALAHYFYLRISKHISDRCVLPLWSPQPNVVNSCSSLNMGSIEEPNKLFCGPLPPDPATVQRRLPAITYDMQLWFMLQGICPF
jgi:hypothetical protein